MTQTYTSGHLTTVRNLALAFAFCALALFAYAPLASAHHADSEETTASSTESHKSGRGSENRSSRGTEQKIKQVEKKIEMLKKQLAVYETLLARLKGTVSSSTASTTVKGTVQTLTTTDTTPLLKGTAKGVGTVSVSLLTGTSTEVYDSGSVSVTNGKWSHTVSPALAIGSYTINLMSPTDTLLATGTLTIE